MIVIGLMSGTSMDGIDAAVAELELDGEVLRLAPLGHDTTPYPDGLAAALRAALPPNQTSMEAVCRLDTAVGQAFAATAEAAHRRHPGAALVVAHGQTVFHWVDPDGRVAGTLQIGRPAWIAERTGLPVISDLRSADVGAGGQGAPLVALFDVLLFGAGGAGAGAAAAAGIRRAALNLGGIANLTVVGPGAAPIAYDAGPANALIDAAVAALTGGAEAYDRGGIRAGRGQVDEALLALLLDDFYRAQPPPKTTGKERYHHGFTEAALEELGREVVGDDLVATLTAHAAEVAAAECRRQAVAEVVASGGGADNPVLMRRLAERLGPIRLRTIDDFGIPSGAKEAYAFAVLGFLTWNGLPGTVPTCTGARHPTILGSISSGGRPLALPPPGRPPSRLEIGTARP